MEIRITTEYINTGGDCISHYNANFVDCNPTLGEFVNWIIENNSDEWGMVEEKSSGIIVEYRRGRIETLCNYYEKMKDKHIKLEHMDGGWSRMDYTITFK